MQIESLQSDLELAANEERIIHNEEGGGQGRSAADLDAMARSRKVVNTPVNGKAKGK